MTPTVPVRVSVVVVNYRVYDELASCLTSIASFGRDGLEVIVVDHSSDRVAARQLRQRFPWIRLEEVSTNDGFAAGVNRAARLATGRYLLLLNPDCVLHGNVPGVLASWLDQHPDVVACGCLVRNDDGSIQASARRFPDLTTGFAGRTSWLSRAWPSNPWTRRNLVAPEAPGEPLVVDWVSGVCLMVRRDAFESIGGMDEGFFLYWEDADLCMRLRRAGWLTVYNPSVEITHLTGRSTVGARAPSLVAFHRSAFRYFRKHGGHLAAAAAPLVFVALLLRLSVKLAFDRSRSTAADVSFPAPEGRLRRSDASAIVVDRPQESEF